MKPEWIKYTGSDEQIEEIANAKAGWIVRYEDCTESQIEYGEPKDMECPTHYLICQPHPLSDMICQQARTGRQVWIKYQIVVHEYSSTQWEYKVEVTNKPNWHIPGAEYRLSPFDEET